MWAGSRLENFGFNGEGRKQAKRMEGERNSRSRQEKRDCHREEGDQILGLEKEKEKGAKKETRSRLKARSRSKDQSNPSERRQKGLTKEAEGWPQSRKEQLTYVDKKAQRGDISLPRRGGTLL